MSINKSISKPLPRASEPKAVKWYRLLEGLKQLLKSRVRNVIAIIIIVSDVMLYRHYHSIIVANNHVVEGISLIKAENALLIALIVLLNLAIFLFSCIQWTDTIHSSRFRAVNLRNRKWQTPALISTSYKDGLIIYTYYVMGIAVEDFIKVLPQLETAFNRTVVKITEGKSKNMVMMYTRKKGIPKHVVYSDEYLPEKESEIALGVSGDGIKVINLDNSPMVFCGGETGSGKTVLLKSALHQAYLHDMEVNLYDGKGFVDFSSFETNRYHCYENKEELLHKLRFMRLEMDVRKKRFKESDCKSITEYNERNSSNRMKRIILATDEVGELFNKKGLAGAEKTLVEDIISVMEIIATQGRAFGIHLWLSTQRGDADRIPPQIRSNLTYRMCGKASDVLSRLTLDNGLATEITADQKGRFVDNEGVFFQAFDFQIEEVSNHE